MIRVQGLRKRFHQGEQAHEVLHGIDLQVPSGDFVALLGRSGSGKSTLLNCLAGIETADSGTIELFGIDLGGLGDDECTRLRRDRIGIVFQFFNLLPVLNVLDNVLLPADLGRRDRAAATERARVLLAELGLADKVSEYPEHLSGGEQQRVAMARALINEPDLLLADEPTGNLDSRTGQQTLELLARIGEQHGLTVLMATHSAEAAQVADRVIHLRDGRLVGSS